MSNNGGDAGAVLAAVRAAGEAGRLSPGSVQNLTRWLTEPQYAGYVPRITELVNAEKFADLDTMFWEVVPFGTGGRRGLMGEFGTATINARTIAESAHGLATYLKKAKGFPGGKAVVARDTRHRSDEFAKLTATTLAAHGLRVYFFEEHRSTPELSFAVRHLQCDVGVMISASHNPPCDNGFKAYWSNGGQVLPPHDKGIIDCVYEAGEIPTVNFEAAVASSQIEVIGEIIDRVYVSQVAALSLSEARDIPAVFTPLHGVGETNVYRIIQEAGFKGVEIFEPQRKPDGGFPNVPDHFPNPERPEVFEPVIPRAKELGAAVILASDPDADRLGVSVREADGEYVHLTGNRIGVLIVDYILRKRKAAGTLSPEHFVVETLVTTPLIGTLGRQYGVRVFDDLLVGFKYIGQMMDVFGQDKFVFGAEESLGYLAGKYARDKDAGIAALYLLECAAELRTKGKTLLDRLDEITIEHGYYLEGQLSKVCKGAAGKQQIDGLLQTFREAPPISLADTPLARVRDYKQHEVRSLPANEKMEDLPLPSGDLLFFESVDNGGDFRIAVRPSGTEPKIKFYFFVRQPCDGAADLAAAKQRGETTLAAIQKDLSDWMDARLNDNG